MLTLIYWNYKYYFAAIAVTIKIINRIAKKIAILIQIGDNTHHHDQSITFVSFNTTNTTVKSSEKPIDTELLVLLIYIPSML